MSAPMRLLLVDDEPTIRVPLAERLADAGLFVKAVATGREAVGQVEQTLFDIAVLDLKLPDISGIEVLRRIVELGSDTDVVMITAYGTIPSAVEAMKLGARDFLTKPFETADLLSVVQRYARIREARREQHSPSGGEPLFHGMLGESPEMHEMFRVILAASEGDAPILLYGETGTGKHLAARAIHDCSARRDGPFVVVSCALIGEEDLECDVSGCARTPTLLTRARGGTLFLDEVAELPSAAQARLLHSAETEHCNPRRRDICGTRIVASTRVDLRARVEAGSFREELFYRLNVLPVTVPPLRARGEDVHLLADQFLRQFTSSEQREARRLSPAARNALEYYAWPGNVRELMNVIARALTLAQDGTIELKHLRLDARVPVAPLATSLQAEEERRIDEALARTSGRKAEAAELLGISRKTLWEKLKRRGKA